MAGRMVNPDCPVDRARCEGPASYYCDDELRGSACRRYYERLDRGDETPAEQLARRFHEAYERLAPDYGYRTREESAKPWREVPFRNRRLMVAVAQELLDSGITPAPRQHGTVDQLVRDAEHLDSEGRPPGHPAYCAEGCIHVDDTGRC